MPEEKEQGLNGNLRCPVYGELSCRGAGCAMWFAPDGCCSVTALAKYQKLISEKQTIIAEQQTIIAQQLTNGITKIKIIP